MMRECTKTELVNEVERLRNEVEALRREEWERGWRDAIAASLSECEVVIDEDPRHIAQVQYTRGRIEKLRSPHDSNGGEKT